MNAKIEQLQQLTTLTWDGNVASKKARDELVDLGYALRFHGWSVVTKDGIKLLLDLDLLKP